ncbi:FAD binding domain-containing protein [Sarocladium implicatum]|nr:FAD binding domain-containing protein [Sarocladium implicatum]
MALTLDSLSANFRGVVTQPQDELFEPLRRRFAENEEADAKLILQPSSEQDITLAVKYAVSNKLEIAVCGQGHSFLGASSSDGVIIDLRRLRTVWVDNEHYGSEGFVTMEAGASVGDVALACEERGVFLPLPSHKELGYAGFTLGGGFGWGMGVAGLGHDLLVEANVVLATGEVVTCSEDKNPDLFFAIRGAGYNFGVISKLQYKAKPLTHQVWYGGIVYPRSAYEAVLEAADKWGLTQQAEDMIAVVITTLVPASQGEEAMLAIVYHHGPSEDTFKERFKPFFDIPSLGSSARLCWAHETADFFPESIWPRTNRLSDGTLFTRVTPQVWLPVIDKLREWMKGDPKREYGTQLFLGLYNWTRVMNENVGKISAWPPTRSPPEDPKGMSWKDMALYVGYGDKKEADEASKFALDLIQFARDKHQEVIGKDIIKGLVYPNAGAMREHSGQYMYKGHYPQLQLLKKKYDPANVFHKKHPIEPAS